ncbi:MAG: preprotein translocase subunit YajC [Cellulomonadaceae bacterium]|jgi:preprotein translocase subunit YajC|nr:preprotein translocase subunit YajC [Cellulomonadaceae bacterium]
MDPFFLIVLVGLVALMFFMSSRQRKQQREQQAFRNELAPGQEIMTASGLFGTIVDIDDDTDRITIDSAGSKSVWLRAAIAKRVDAPVEETDSDIDTDNQDTPEAPKPFLEGND